MRIRIEELFAIAAAVALMVLGVVASDRADSLQVFDFVRSMFRYVTFAFPGSGFLHVFLFFFYAFLFWLAYRLPLNYVVKRFLGYELSKPPDWKKVGKTLSDLGRGVAVMALTFVPSSFLLGWLDVVLRNIGKDLWLWHMDELLLGHQLFIALPTLLPQTFVAQELWVLYTSLPLVMGSVLVITFIVSRAYLFRWALLSFSICFFFAWPFFVNVPCQDPGEFFIRNVREETFSPSVQQELSEYAPGYLTEKLVNQLQTAETSVYDNSNVVPISCFPSMHAQWGVLSVFFLTIINRRLIIPLLVWLVVMLAGGIYFAQHYFVDYLVAVPIALFSIAVSWWLVVHDMADGKNQKKSVRSIKIKEGIKDIFLS